MKRIFKTNKEYFNFIDKNKDKIKDIKLTIKPKSVRVDFEPLTQTKKKVNK